MLSFHNDVAIKRKYLRRVRAHRAADLLVKGATGSPSRGEKGCAVACTMDVYDHARYPIEIGVPEWLARLEDTIFEGLPKKDEMEWPVAFLAAIPVGVDLEPLKHRIGIRRMDRLLVQLKKLPEAEYLPKVIAAVEMVRRCHEAELGKDSCDWSAAWSASSAAESASSAAWSASSAAESAAESAWSAARSAAWSASSAAESARSAAWSAESAAESAAAYKAEAEAVIEELKAMKK